MLYVFVEGPDDYTYFDKVFGGFWESYKIITYSHMKKSKLNDFIRSVSSMPGCDYLFFCDEDGKGIENKKAELLSNYNQLSTDRIFVVQYEIESWYYAGASTEICKKLKLVHYQEDTNSLTKEQFDHKLQRPSDRKYIMVQLLLQYSKDLAKTRNNSFGIFFNAVKEPAAV